MSPGQPYPILSPTHCTSEPCLMAGCSPFGCGSWLGRTGWVQHPTGHLIPGWTECNKPSEGEAWGSIPPLSPPAVGWVLPSHPQSKQTQQPGLIKRYLWCEGGDIREDFRVGFAPPPHCLHHAHLSLLSQNWRITTQSQQASHTLRSIRNNEKRFVIRMQVPADFSNISS